MTAIIQYHQEGEVTVMTMVFLSFVVVYSLLILCCTVNLSVLSVMYGTVWLHVMDVKLAQEPADIV